MSSSSPTPPAENHQTPPQQAKSRRVSFRLEPSPSRNRLIVHVPKDQIFGRSPTPESSQKDNDGPRRRSGCCCSFRCWCTLFSLLLVLVFTTAALLIFVFPPKPPQYTIEKISFRNLNLTSPTRNSLTTIDLILLLRNENKKVGFNFTEPGSIFVSTQSGLILATGALPVFYLPKRSEKYSETTLRNSFETLYKKDHDELLFQEYVAKRIQLKIDMKVPLKMQLFSMQSWTIKANVHCETSVDQFREDAKHGLGGCRCKAKWGVREM